MIRIVVVEDQEIVRRGLKTLLQRKPDFQIVGEAANGQAAIELVSTLGRDDQCPDVVLMDIQMPVMDGVAATQKICQQFPTIKVLMLTTFDDVPHITEAMRYGAKGYVLKDTPSKELAEIIRSIDRGYTQFSPGILEKMLTGMQPKTDENVDDNAEPSLPQAVPPQQPTAPAELPPGFTELTNREREVLCLITAGQSNKEIANQLCVTEGTARNHISRILSRLNVRDRTQAAIVASNFLDWLKSSDTSNSAN
ncbi:response regulator transcription factor [filamentous cyanobacterium LEGE 11480]|uniref:Response regulator transcription factor n=1 Tax=Romeriopsis navalis LEGE 11480 TaxID=2777977 RepID=A0A928Z4W8_9CYAN|nr:response regulator transcription factor [Romeriopsis navalis]MBE9030635.1 response regulator transcription factor [Romeriopsis navalis LEGE 11480]